MKKLILSLLMSLTVLASFAQNGGQNSENTTVKIEFVSLQPNGQAYVKVTNKQSCTVNMRIKADGTQFVSIPGGQADTILVTLPSNKLVQAKSMTDCGLGGTGEVELDVQGYLPIHFEYVKARRLDAKTIEIEFRANETESVKQYNMQVSFDGKTYETVTILFPDTLQPHRIYKVKITLK